jgi:hypothetical protein
MEFIRAKKKREFLLSLHILQDQQMYIPIRGTPFVPLYGWAWGAIYIALRLISINDNCRSIFNSYKQSQIDIFRFATPEEIAGQHLCDRSCKYTFSGKRQIISFASWKNQTLNEFAAFGTKEHTPKLSVRNTKS